VRPSGLSPQTTRALWRKHYGYGSESSFDPFRKDTYRELTAPTKRCQHCSLTDHSLTARFVIQLRADLTSRIIDARLNCQSALTRRWAHLLGRENLRNLMSESKPMESSGREHNSIILAFLQFAQARVHVTADRLSIQIWPQNSQLCRAPAGTGTHPGAVS
jgi:hypothetical protein